MQLQDFVSKPTPKKLSINTPEIIEKYGEPLDFYILNPLPVELYLRLSELTTVEFVREVMVTEKGEKAIQEGQSLAGSLLPLVSTAVWEELGKLPVKS